MRHEWVSVLLAASAPAAFASPLPPAMQCLAAAALAEQRWHLPAGVLAAIGEVESGRPDAASGTAQPWPWTANVAGLDYVFGSALEAVNVVGFLRARGIGSIDVGCFQVNLHHHPQAFASVREGFDPAANADYAGRFLRALFERSGSWVAAIAAYHSADPDEGGPYRAKVLRAWFSRRTAWPEATGGVVTISVAIPVYTPATLPAPMRAAVQRAMPTPSVWQW